MHEPTDKPLKLALTVVIQRPLREAEMEQLGWNGCDLTGFFTTAARSGSRSRSTDEQGPVAASSRQAL